MDVDAMPASMVRTLAVAIALGTLFWVGLGYALFA